MRRDSLPISASKMVKTRFLENHARGGDIIFNNPAQGGALRRKRRAGRSSIGPARRSAAGGTLALVVVGGWWARAVFFKTRQNGKMRKNTMLRNNASTIMVCICFCIKRVAELDSGIAGARHAQLEHGNVNRMCAFCHMFNFSNSVRQTGLRLGSDQDEGELLIP